MSLSGSRESRCQHITRNSCFLGSVLSWGTLLPDAVQISIPKAASTVLEFLQSLYSMLIQLFWPWLSGGKVGLCIIFPSDMALKCSCHLNFLFLKTLSFSICRDLNFPSFVWADVKSKYVIAPIKQNEKWIVSLLMWLVLVNCQEWHSYLCL